MALKIYTNEATFSNHKENSYLLISDGFEGGSITGCIIKSPKNNFGYKSTWNKDFFTEVKEFDISVPKANIIGDNKLFVYGTYDRKSCIIDFENKEIIVNSKKIEKIIRSVPQVKLKLKSND